MPLKILKWFRDRFFASLNNINDTNVENNLLLSFNTCFYNCLLSVCLWSKKTWRKQLLFVLYFNLTENSWFVIVELSQVCLHPIKNLHSCPTITCVRKDQYCTVFVVFTKQPCDAAFFLAIITYLTLLTVNYWFKTWCLPLMW